MLNSTTKKNTMSTKGITLPNLHKGLRPNTTQGLDLLMSTRSMGRAKTAYIPEYTDYDSQKTYINAQDNMTSTNTFQNAEVRRNRDLLFECRDNINKYKQDMKKLETNWNHNMEMTIGSIELRMKEFSRKLKIESTYADKEHTSLHQEGDTLDKEMSDLAQQIALAEQRIQRLEAFTGVGVQVFQTNEEGVKLAQTQP